MTDEQLKLAVFIDFDNIEIGVKTTLNATFDVGAVLEAIKERGEVVTKVAYGDWKRAGDHSRLLTQQAIRMVQRNVTPGGDKNGADINLALDALEMALTHDHINAFVIVGGDSDFISLVEKLKQYDKKVLVVGGRAFTSVILQKNCHEFIAYENVIAPQASRRQQERARPAAASTAAASSPISDAVPLVRRALAVLSERDVSPQLGLFKSTLLQLDSTFSERNYGSGSFRDFAEKLAQTGLVTLKQSGRSLLVELKDTGDDGAMEPGTPPEEARPQVVEPPAPPEPKAESAAEEQPSGQPHDAVRVLQRMFETVPQQPRWPMYIRNVKQLIRSMDSSFDERRYGFTGILDLLRAAQRENVLRLERDRQGTIRVFSGAAIQRPPAEAAVAAVGAEAEAVEVPEQPGKPIEGEVVAAAAEVAPLAEEVRARREKREEEEKREAPEALVVDAEPVPGAAGSDVTVEAPSEAGEQVPAAEAEAGLPAEAGAGVAGRAKKRAPARQRGTRTARKTTTAAKAPASRARKTTARKPRATRARAKE